MEQSPWEADSHSASQDIPRFFEIRSLITAFTNAQIRGPV